jgi:hypothetical protein
MLSLSYFLNLVSNQTPQEAILKGQQNHYHSVLSHSGAFLSGFQQWPFTLTREHSWNKQLSLIC